MDRWIHLYQYILNCLGGGEYNELEARENLKADFTKKEVSDFFWLERDKWIEKYGGES